MPDLTTYSAKLQTLIDAAQAHLDAQTDPDLIAQAQAKLDLLVAKKARVDTK
jgi:hypothetical protein